MIFQRSQTCIESMNLSECYVPEWDAWDVFREIVCNAWDHDRQYRLDRIDSDAIVVESHGEPPNPKLLTVVGAGTKSADDDAIGMFGEGFKLAALATHRLGGTMVVELPGESMTFELFNVEGLNERVLHAIHSFEQGDEGVCRVIVKLTGVGDIRGRILRTRDTLRMPQQDARKMRVFAKGVWVRDFDVDALWDWSFDDLKLNRDRAVPNIYDIRWRIVQYLNAQASLDDCVRLVEQTDSFEAQALQDYPSNVAASLKTLLVDAFRRIYGDDARIASSDSRSNVIAAEHGYKSVATSSGIAQAISTACEPVMRCSEVRRAVCAVDDTEEPERVECSRLLRRAIDLIEQRKYADAGLEINAALESLTILVAVA